MGPGLIFRGAGLFILLSACSAPSGPRSFEKHLREKLMERESWPILKELNPSLN